MSAIPRHGEFLLAAELQFRLASAVRLATTMKVQPLDLPEVWSHGEHVVTNQDVALSPEQADFAAWALHRSATLLMAVAIRDALRAAFPDPKNSPDPDVRAAYQIARLIRNAFAHGPFAPTWSIDPDCRDKTFAVTDIISLDTTGLQGVAFDWRHYGGPLALMLLCRFVRVGILKHDPPTVGEVPHPTVEIHQIGNLVLTKVAELPEDAVLVNVERNPDGSIPLGGGFVVRGPRDE